MFRIVSKKPSIIWATETEIDDERLDSKFYDVQFIETQNKLLKSPLTKKKLGEIMKSMNSPIGWQGIPSSAYRRKGEGIPLLRVQNIQDNQIDWDTIIDVDPEIYFSQPAIQSEAGDIIITRVGTIGRFCKVPSNVPKIAMGQNLTRVSFDRQVVDADYILAYMNTQYCINQMYRLAYGGVQPSLTNKNIRDILLLIPSMKIQNYIGNKLRKAEELQEEAKLLSEKAKKLVINKLGDIPQKITEKEKWGYIKTDTLSSSRLDANYYSGVYLEIEKLLKNRTKSFSTLSSLCKRISQGYNKNNYGTCNNAFAIGIGDFGDLSPIKNEEKKVGFPTEKTLQKFDIIWCSTAHLQKYIGEKINIVMEPDVFVPTPEITFIRPDISKINPYYLFIFMQTEWGYYQIQRTVKGLVPRSYPEDIKEIIIPLIEFTDEELSVLQDGVEKVYKNYLLSKTLIKEAKQDVEDLIEGKFNESKVSEGV